MAEAMHSIIHDRIICICTTYYDTILNRLLNKLKPILHDLSQHANPQPLSGEHDKMGSPVC